MQHRYIKKLDLSLSPLGFGVMRLPMNPDGTFSAEVHRLMGAAYERGINYYDTAYPYLGGHSEELIRDALTANHPRDSFFIADKLPVWECGGAEDMERIFNTQLLRLGTDYIDFYLLHSLHRARWLDIRDKGVLVFLDKKRKEGKIRKVGFSMHDTPDTLRLILNDYDWEFAQLQINYYDWRVQNAHESYAILEERGIPCFVMEPVGGGRLAALPEAAEKILKYVCPENTIASWAIRFAASLPNVAVTLSGMSDMAQLEDNVSCFEPIVPLSVSENKALEEAVSVVSSRNTVPCGGCGYCVYGCPKNIDIPQIFKLFNDFKLFGDTARLDVSYFAFVPESRRADKCVTCGKCVKLCPQNISIPEKLRMMHSEAVRLAIGTDIEKLRDNDRLILFSAGVDGKNVLSLLNSVGVAVRFFCDNNPSLWGAKVQGVEVVSPQELQELEAQVLITSSKYYETIKAQLDDLGVETINI